MKVTIPAPVARSAAITIKRLAPIARSVIGGVAPVLSGAHIAAARSALTIRVTDLDVHAAVTIDADVCSEGETVVPAAVLARLFANARGDVIILSADDGSDVVITHGTFCSRLKPMPVEDFPVAFTVGGGAFRFTVDSEDVAMMARLANITDTTRHALSGVLLHAVGDRLALAADDDHRRVESVCDTSFTGSDILISAATAELIGTLLPDGGDFASDGRILEVSGSAVRIASKLVDDVFPDYPMPSPSGSAATVDAYSLAGALAHVEIIAFKHNRGAIVSWDHEAAPGEVRVTLGQSPFGTGIIVLEGETVGIGRVGVGLDHAIGLLEAMKVSRVTLDHAGGTAPILITVPDRPRMTAMLAPLWVRSNTVTEAIVEDAA